MYLFLMKHTIKTRCSILEIQLFPERKFSHLNFASSFIDFDYGLMQLMEFLVKVSLIIIFQVCSTPYLHGE